MIGGGPGSFIGGVHRIAARMDGEYDLVAGAFSSKPEKCLETARELGISEDRAYGSWKELIEKELDRPEKQRVQVIMITTPNHVHAAPTITALEAGYHVVLDKPLCTSMEEAHAYRTSGVEKCFGIVLSYSYLHWLSYGQRGQAPDCFGRSREGA
jgi:predicted dehydrogenase